MKRYLLLFLSICIALATTAAPWDIKTPPTAHLAWDKPLEKAKAFTDTYVTTYGAYVVGDFWLPNYAVNLQVYLNQSCPVKWLVTIQVFGHWNPAPSAASYRVFDLVFNSGQWMKNINFPMGINEEAYTSLVDLLYDGPY